MSPRLIFDIPGAAVPAARPRAYAVRGRGGAPVLVDGRPVIRAFVPTETTNYEERVAIFARAAVQQCPEWQAVFARRSPLRIHVHVVRQAWRGDWDNFAKGVCDGMQKASTIFDNDNRITQALVSMHTDKAAVPRTEVVVEPSNALLEHPLWMQCAIEAGWLPPDEWQGRALAAGWRRPSVQATLPCVGDSMGGA